MSLNKGLCITHSPFFLLPHFFQRESETFLFSISSQTRQKKPIRAMQNSSKHTTVTETDLKLQKLV